MPVFITEIEDEFIPIKTLPGISRFGYKNILDYLGKKLFKTVFNYHKYFIQYF